MGRLHFYLRPGGLAQLLRGERTMPGRIIEALRGVGWQVIPCPEDELSAMPTRAGYHMLVNLPVTAPRCLVLRVAGFEPFYQIERTNDRWDWEIARRDYHLPDVPQPRIDAFLDQWRGHVLKDVTPSQGGGVFVPLQGKLLESRSFQAASPQAMLQETIARFPDRPILATLHPRETYTEAERQMLQDLQARHPNFRLVEGSMAALAACDLVVTQNSTLALKGFLLNKPAILWGRIDWHHIAASVPRQGVAAAYAEALAPRDFGRYLFWYCRRQSLFAWEDNPKAILWRLRQLGWPVE